MITLIYSSIFGLLIGSFLNVCIYRVPRKLSVWQPMRSFCPNCEQQLSWWENIPVLSWILLGAKCRSCSKSISGQYPLVELLSAFAAAGSYLRFGLTPDGILIYCFSATLIVITFIDFEHRIIPDRISFPGMTFGLLLGIFCQYTNFFGPLITHDAWDSLVGLLFGGGFFYVIGYGYYFFTGQAGLGGGDIKLMGMIGAILGWRAIPTTILAGSIAGSLVGIAVMLISGSGRKTEIPFGPWLSIGVLIYVFSDFRFLQLYGF